ncbi:hypothetical protein MSSAC_2240 [Methanosarcina siciliae C2J]|uniref:Uncharacterized protein n=1 Tax=Methanosarcina siciliae C2J TaxID=1434118 RepID=A0A0E3PNR3_9EURY|nr:DUF3303 family protein [Methanosarcina siciliae]AKB36830.1 hypothetical protein MSSAC_2240 [Methanosarcina siciliae C2J]
MKNVLLLDITTFELENSVKLFKRWEQVLSRGAPKGVKVLNRWFEAGGERIITVYDVESIKDYATYNLLFTDLCHTEVFPVVGAEEFKKFVSKCMDKLNPEAKIRSSV